MSYNFNSSVSLYLFEHVFKSLSNYRIVVEISLYTWDLFVKVTWTLHERMHGKPFWKLLRIWWKSCRPSLRSTETYHSHVRELTVAFTGSTTCHSWYLSRWNVWALMLQQFSTPSWGAVRYSETCGVTTACKNLNTLLREGMSGTPLATWFHLLSDNCLRRLELVPECLLTVLTYESSPQSPAKRS